MKDVLSLVVFGAAVFGLVTFVTVVTPASIDAVQTATNAVGSRMERSGMQTCRLNLLAASQDVDAGTCGIRPSAH